MSVIQKVANRIQARRRASSNTNSSSPAPTGESENDRVSFSTVNRQDSSDFCLVDGQKETSRDRSGSPDNFHHELNQVADELFQDFDYEDEQPRLKAAGDQVSESTSKPWRQASKDVYEQQLELLQDQLMTAMMEKQTLESELEKQKSTQQRSDKELEDLRKQTSVLSRRVKGMDAARLSPEGSKSYAGGSLRVSTSEEGYQQVSMTPNEGAVGRRQTQKKSYLQATREWFYDFLADFTNDPSSQTEQQEEPPTLSYKKLKVNLQRLLYSSKPWREMGQHAQDVLAWKHTAETLVIFLIYMYCVWSGWLITLLLLIAIFKLSINYLHASGLAEQFGFPYPYRRQQIEEAGLADKLQLVKRVAENCQNASGQVSDALEKSQNLLLWHQPEATQKLYFALFGWLLASIFLSTSHILTLVGLFLGVKLFIVDNIYRKYPKVQDKYDTVHRIWKTLPTDAELYRRQSLTEEELHRSQSTDSLSSTRSDNSLNHSSVHSDEHISFCQRFQIPLEEHPLPSWESGKRCSIMDRDKPLSLTRSGRLFMTHRYLCFERMSHSARDSDRISILLADVVCVVKAKPFAVLPGSGMSIEVTRADGQKCLFSAILGRDQVYQNILDQGMLLGLPWGSDLITGGRVTNTGASNDANSRAGSEEGSCVPEANN